MTCIGNFPPLAEFLFVKRLQLVSRSPGPRLLQWCTRAPRAQRHPWLSWERHSECSLSQWGVGFRSNCLPVNIECAGGSEHYLLGPCHCMLCMQHLYTRYVSALTEQPEAPLTLEVLKFVFDSQEICLIRCPKYTWVFCCFCFTHRDSCRHVHTWHSVTESLLRHVGILSALLTDLCSFIPFSLIECWSMLKYPIDTLCCFL